MKSIYEFLLSEHLLKSKTTTSTQDTGYVDLGLPSGLLWAKCNIGADDPYEYGDYFMWGSTEPDTNKPCDWKTCPFNDGSNDYDKKYFNSIKDKICKNGILSPDYDAATIILGPDWRLPTGREFQELIDNTKHAWIANYKSSKIKGLLFTPMVSTPKNAEANSNENDAELGAELFIPAAGYRSESSFHDRRRNAYLWGSSLYTGSPYYARNLYFNNTNCYISYDDRFYGFCLRAVKENK